MKTCPPCYLRNLCKGLHCVGEALNKDGWFINDNGDMQQIDSRADRVRKLARMRDGH
jgi:hypothetical protein